ncbi:MAG TPA: hypothetical protein VEC60_02330 [Reyranella sp.]|nr:hypothetical protein [Reyranella sp.]
MKGMEQAIHTVMVLGVVIWAIGAAVSAWGFWTLRRRGSSTLHRFSAVLCAMAFLFSLASAAVSAWQLTQPPPTFGLPPKSASR